MTAYVVLGMHKSGTTLVAEILHRAGIPMVEEAGEADYDTGNKWERRSTSDLDKALLDARDTDSLDLDPPEESALLDEVALERARELVAELGAGGDDWGFKDPRACFTWPLWRRVLERPRIVGVYRHHGAVADHFRNKAGAHHRVGRFWRSRVARRALRRWCQYNERVLEAVEAASGPSILLSYERLMQGDAELDRLRAFLGRDLEDPRDPAKFRHREAGALRSRVSAWKARLLGEGNAPALYARLESRRELQESSAPRSSNSRRS